MKKNTPVEIINLQSLRVLIVEDSEDDALLEIRELKRGGYNPVYECVETAAAMKEALQKKQWDMILCDYKMPKFNAPSAIAVVNEANIDIPIIIVSGTIGEDVAIECMRLGAQDYIMKGNLSRLCPAIARELKEAEVKNKQKQAESQREAALELLRQSEEKYRSILENIEDGYYEVDLAGNFTFFNDSTCLLLGYSREELMGMNNRQYTVRKSSKRLFEAFNKVYKTEEPAKEIDWQIIRKDRVKRYAEASASLKKDSSGKPIGFRGIIRDITERNQMEEKMWQDQQELQAIMDASPIGVSWSDMQGNIKYNNLIFQKLFGYTVEDIPNIATWFLRACPSLATGNRFLPRLCCLWTRRIKGKELHP